MLGNNLPRFASDHFHQHFDHRTFDSRTVSNYKRSTKLGSGSTAAGFGGDASAGHSSNFIAHERHGRKLYDFCKITINLVNLKDSKSSSRKLVQHA